MNFSAFFTIFIMETLGSVASLRSFIHTEGNLKSMWRMIFAHEGVIYARRMLENLEMPLCAKIILCMLFGAFQGTFHINLFLHETGCSWQKLMQLNEAKTNIWDVAYDNNYDGVPPSRVSFNLFTLSMKIFRLIFEPDMTSP